LGGLIKLFGNESSILPLDLKELSENLCRFKGIVERKENTKFYAGIIEHMWARMIKSVEVVSGHHHYSKILNSATELHVGANSP
jgi:hypothetical protein